MFISTGSCLFTIFSLRIGASVGTDSPDRIAAQIVTGVGFLGAGVILRQGGEVRGLTTAALVWLAAALGMGIGGGFYLISFLAAFLVLLVLFAFPYFERWLNTVNQVRTYQISFLFNEIKYKELLELFTHFKLRLIVHRPSRIGDEMTLYWAAHGHPRNHDALTVALLEDRELHEVTLKAE
jgi:putative Mg2+ transporter-C (MgtC) family protein